MWIPFLVLGSFVALGAGALLGGAAMLIDVLQRGKRESIEDDFFTDRPGLTSSGAEHDPYWDVVLRLRNSRNWTADECREVAEWLTREAERVRNGCTNEYADILHVTQRVVQSSRRTAVMHPRDAAVKLLRSWWGARSVTITDGDYYYDCASHTIRDGADIRLTVQEASDILGVKVAAERIDVMCHGDAERIFLNPRSDRLENVNGVGVVRPVLAAKFPPNRTLAQGELPPEAPRSTFLAPRMAVPQGFVVSALWARVWAKATLPDDPDACVLWRGALSLKRLGRRSPVIRNGARCVSVARLICTWFHGAPREDQEAGHTCPTGENALCINPKHLAWQTREENEQFKRARERLAYYQKSTPITRPDACRIASAYCI